MKTIIRSGSVATPSGLRAADILIDGDVIRDIIPEAGPHPGARIIDARDRIAVPGLINCHTHAHNNLARGIEDNLTLEELRGLAPVLVGARTLEEQYLSAALGAVEMLETGCTTAFDMFTAAPAMTLDDAGSVVQAYLDVGMRAILAPSMNDGPFYASVPGLLESLPPGLRRALESTQAAPARVLADLSRDAIRRWDGADGRIAIAVSPAVPGECSDDYLAALGGLAREYGTRLQTHLAETKVQAVGAVARWGESLVCHLSRQGLIGPNFIGGHGVWLTPEEIRLLSESGAGIAHNPASNLRLGSGFAPVWELLSSGATVGLGADGSMSSDNQNMFEAMRIAALASRSRFPQRTEAWLGAEAIRDIATRGSARLLGLAGRIGELVPGAKADIVLLDARSSFLTPLHALSSALVYSETGASVRTVLVGGRVVVEEGKVVTVNREQLMERARQAAERVGSRVRLHRGLADEIRPFLRAACKRCHAAAFPVDRDSPLKD